MSERLTAERRAEIERDLMDMPPYLKNLIWELCAEIDALQRPLTHPQIHLDFYAWWKEMCFSDKDETLAKEATVDVAMFAWTRSRETILHTLCGEKGK